MRINFFDDPLETPKPREDVRLNQLGLFVYPDGRRIAVGFDITPFLERPSIEVRVINANGEAAGSLNVIQTLESNFNLTMHLRDKEPTEIYEITAVLYYTPPNEPRMIVHTLTRTFNATITGNQ